MHALVGASSVDSVLRITGNFASESPLHPAAKEALLAAFDQGWADPKKLSQAASRAAILRNQSLENIASRLAIPVESVEVLGEPHVGHFLAIAGLFQPASPFIYSSVDKGKIRAIARAHSGEVHQLEVDTSGAIQWEEFAHENSVLSLQLANGETGVIQTFIPQLPESFRIAVDATSSGPQVELPHRWDTALFDSLSWNGPAGLAIMAIKDRARYSYPLPRIAPISAPGSYSLPLLIASSIALENFQMEDVLLREFAAEAFSSIEGIQVVAPGVASLPHLLSLVIANVSGEQVVRELVSRGIDLDSGSACSAEDLQPSHVLAAMGYETTGHIRMTLHRGVTHSEISALAATLSEVVTTLRR